MSRPFVLDPLFRPITDLSGVGPKNAKLISKLCGGERIRDLLWHFPIDYIDRRFTPKINNVIDGRVATIEVTVLQHMPNSRRSQPYRIKVNDGTGEMTLTFFHANKDWLKKILPENQKKIISGKVEFYHGAAQIVHPEVAKISEKATLTVLEPVYGLTAGLSNKTLQKAVQSALSLLPEMPEWLDLSYKKRNKWQDWSECIRSVHLPNDTDIFNPNHPARQRLAFDELLSKQVTLALLRANQKKNAGRALPTKGELRTSLLANLPFTLTNAQKKAIEEIDADMASPDKMLRLLQGDVGSGKTLVAALAMLNAVDNGAQAALLAPTEILARQHAQTLSPLLQACGVRVVTLTGRDKGSSRDLMLKQIKDGTAQVIIGTHAIFQNEVHYHDLGLAVIDEQHRFGVEQRLALSSKGESMDVLVMTATPIPRTLTLTAYGDMDVSRLNEKPPGRKPVQTLLIPKEKIDDMLEGLKRQLKQGVRIYWVCPLVEESEFSDMAAAEERYDVLKAVFGDEVGLVHGRIKAEEKDETMQQFAQGKLKILVATTVIEVGVNVPEATIIVIEHAERFGLSQLHQLRGRVGRGSEQSFCFLLYSTPLGPTAKERLSIMRASEDGFLIAEKDLELRGSGDILGVKQSGMSEYKLADLNAHKDIIAAARDDARLIIGKDPVLKEERGQALRTLLYLFGCDRAFHYLQSG